MHLAARQHHQPNKNEMAVGLRENFSVQFTLFLTVEDDQIEPILKGLQRRSYCRVRVYRLVQISPAGIHPAFGQPIFDLALGQDAKDLSVLLPLFERFESCSTTRVISWRNVSSSPPSFSSGGQGTCQSGTSGLRLPSARALIVRTDIR